MPTIYHSHYSGWTRSKAKAIAACCKGTREDGGGVVEDVWAHHIPVVTLAEMLNVLNDAAPWPATHVASVQHGRLVPPAVS